MHEQRIGLDPAEVNLTLRPGGAAGGGASAEERKKAEARVAAIRGNFDMGVKLSNEGKHDEAIAKFNEVLKEAPKCVECYTNIASLQLTKKDYDAAEATYKQALEVNPSSAEAYNGLATVYNAQKKFDQAAEASAQAAKLGAATPGRRQRVDGLQPGRHRVERQQDPRGQEGVRRGRQARPEAGRSALLARHGQPQRRQDARSGDVVRGVPQARSVGQVRRAGQGHPDADQEVTASLTSTIRSARRIVDGPPCR